MRERELARINLRHKLPDSPSLPQLLRSLYLDPTLAEHRPYIGCLLIRPFSTNKHETSNTDNHRNYPRKFESIVPRSTSSIDTDLEQMDATQDPTSITPKATASTSLQPAPVADAPPATVSTDSASIESREFPADALAALFDFDYGYEDDFEHEEGSCDGCEICSKTTPSTTTTDQFYFSQRPATPKAMEPPLTSFQLFPKLPIELREMIWQHALDPRTVEIHYNAKDGFHSDAKIPVALKVCTDSRNAVLKSYSLCFGSLLNRPKTLVNFSLDTLYFEMWMQPRFTQFLVSLSKTEAANIQSIAVDSEIEEFPDMGMEFPSEDSALETLKAASPALPSLKEIFIVHKLWDNDSGTDFGFPVGRGPPVLFERFTYELQMYAWQEAFPRNGPGEDFGSSQTLPGAAYIKTDFINVPEVTSIFCWRPANLPGVPLPPWPHPSMLRNSKS